MAPKFVFVTVGTLFSSSGSVEEQFPKLLLNGGKAASSPKGHAADAVGKVQQMHAISFLSHFCHFSFFA